MKRRRIKRKRTNEDVAGKEERDIEEEEKDDVNNKLHHLRKEK